MKKPSPKYEPSERFTVEKDGFYGSYYEPEKNNFSGKGMVVCSGSDGSFLLTTLDAEKFYEAGMPVIALGYWNTEGTPQGDSNIPVEYMQKACHWLKENKGLHPGVWGISLGGCYVLLSASLFPEIECVVAVSPMHVLIQGGSFKHGIHFEQDGPFTYQGKMLPFVKLDEETCRKHARIIKRNLLLKQEPDMLFHYQKIMEDAKDPDVCIKVENIKGPILLLSGGEDVMLPSNQICRIIMKRLQENHFAYPYKHCNYPILSHYVTPLKPMTTKFFRVERKHPEECDANREKSWRDTLEFLQNEWKVQRREEKCLIQRNCFDA
ncbi:MAG: acyl-CoA thioester hydrolase/BAAT C-terminal domain-containing protein [Bulleidia sp.]|nr:acyl-CoA thioester hydrolase/BAAT C-terminal domain-containing protein [Bulleidia sp.]